MPHPGDHRCFGTLFDGDALGPSHGAAAHGRGMIGNGLCELLSEWGVVGVEVEERENGGAELFHVFGLSVVTASSVGGSAPGIFLG